MRLASLLLVLALCAPPAAAQERRALLVGINTYTPRGGGPSDRAWRDLEGAVSDAEAVQSLLVTRFGFAPARVRLLREAEATRAAILEGLEALAGASRAGDEVVFFFAGHGSQVRNEATREADGLDETLVPADAAAGAPDLRDKELRDAFAAIVRRGARLTVIVDACHSGSALRGVSGGRERRVEAAAGAVADPSAGPEPEAMPGVLVLSAAQDDEAARELRDEGGRPRGAFSWALVHALAGSVAGESATEVFQRARARVKERGLSQEPVLAGAPERRRAPFFGGGETAPRPLQLPVLEARRGRVVLQGGPAVGVGPGARLRTATPAGDTIRVVVSGTEGVGRSVAPLPEGVRVEPGTVFTVEAWATLPDAALRLWVPPALPPPQRAALAGLLQRLATPGSLRLVQDPAQEAPTHTLAFTAAGWRLLATGAGPRPVRLDAAFDAALGRGAGALLVLVPPPDTLLAALRQSLRPLPVTLVRTPEEADYVLGGDGRRTFWVRGGGADVPGALPPHTAALDTGATGTTARQLADQAARLARIAGWLALESPPDGAEAFPYRLTGFENVRTGERRAAGDTLRAGERYRALLAFPETRRDQIQARARTGDLQSRYVYLFAIDAAGRGTLLYPVGTAGSVENRIRLTGDVAPEVRLPRTRGAYLFDVAPPFGTDTFFLLTTEEPLPDPSILTFDGLRTRRAPGRLTPLARMLFGLGENLRGEAGDLPSTWSLQRVTVPSAARR